MRIKVGGMCGERLFPLICFQMRYPLCRLWYGNGIGYAKHRIRSHEAVINVYDVAGNVIATHEHKGDFKEW